MPLEWIIWSVGYVAIVAVALIILMKQDAELRTLRSILALYKAVVERMETEMNTEKK